jgi:biotin carboxyl carrier protein
MMPAGLYAAGDGWVIEVDGVATAVSFYVDRDVVHIHAFGRTWRVEVVDSADRATAAGDQSDVARAPMPGLVVGLFVGVGDAVTSGQTLAIIESMKMQTEIKASREGTVHQVHFREGETFELHAPLVTLVSLDPEA